MQKDFCDKCGNEIKDLVNILKMETDEDQKGEHTFRFELCEKCAYKVEDYILLNWMKGEE